MAPCYYCGKDTADDVDTDAPNYLRACSGCEWRRERSRNFRRGLARYLGLPWDGSGITPT